MALVAWVGAAVAAIALWRLVADGHSPPVATRAVLILLFGPYALFLMASYTEGLFLALAIPAWLCATRRRWWLAGILAGLAASIRINGVMLGAGLVTMFLLQWRRNDRRPRPSEAPALALPFAVTFGYFAYIHAKTGDWMGWQHAEQQAWDKKLVAPWTALSHSIHRLTESGMTSDVRLQSWMEIIFAAIGLAFVVAFAVRKAWPELVYGGLIMASGLCSNFY